MSQPNFLYKALIIGALSLVLLLVLSMIRGTILERQSYRTDAIDYVQKSYAGPMKFAGPVLIVPFQDEETLISKDKNGLESRTIVKKENFWIYYPKTMNAQGSMVPDTKKLGIHEVRVFEWNAQMSAEFELTPQNPNNPLIQRRLGKPYLSMSMNDTRGLIGNPVLRVKGIPQQIKQGAGSHGFAEKSKGVHVMLPELALGQAQKFSVQLNFVLAGTESLSFVPIADNNTINIESPWPHPQFGGDFSPRMPSISDKGFKANWNISSLSTSAQTQYRNNASMQDLDSLQVNLVDPIDIYLKADRASKYAFLFIGLTFVGFLLFEIIKQLSIHPIQYSLVGMSLAIFFLLLISLSEHINFLLSYLIASSACIGLLFMYLKSVLKSFSRGLGFSVILTLLYAMLYGLLVSEDNALVMGSIMMFTILATLMLVTRHVDWYTINKPNA